MSSTYLSPPLALLSVVNFPLVSIWLYTRVVSSWRGSRPSQTRPNIKRPEGRLWQDLLDFPLQVFRMHTDRSRTTIALPKHTQLSMRVSQKQPRWSRRWGCKGQLVWNGPQGFNIFFTTWKILIPKLSFHSELWTLSTLILVFMYWNMQKQGREKRERKACGCTTALRNIDDWNHYHNCIKYSCENECHRKYLQITPLSGSEWILLILSFTF